MLASTIALYFYVRNLLQHEVEEELHSTEARIESSISGESPIYQLPPMVEVEPVYQLGVEHLKDTLIFDPSQNELEDFRELTTYAVINANKYRITVRALIVESEDILAAVVISYLVIILFVFGFLFYFNKAWNQKLWHPFFNNLEQMKLFSLTSETPIALMQSDILEFSELNSEITTLTEKVRSDYKNLKQYTEDVSHEMQTPLAIIQAKIENIINGDNLNDSQYEHLTSIQKDIHRLTQMNKRLTLLTKIENLQFSNPELLDLNEVVKKRIDNFSEIYASKIEFIEKGRVNIKIDAYLADVLVDNLISNALKHSIVQSSIVIEITDREFSVRNKGVQRLQNPERLFTRFYQEKNQKKSMGLGLAIVQKICDLYGFAPRYDFADEKHIFTININP